MTVAYTAYAVACLTVNSIKKKLESKVHLDCKSHSIFHMQSVKQKSVTYNQGNTADVHHADLYKTVASANQQHL